MFKKLAALLGIGLASAGGGGQHASAGFTPYKNPAFNTVYNLLFCDNLDLFRTKETAAAGKPWSVLLAEKPNLAALRALAEDTSQESRVRALAYNRLRASGQQVPRRQLLGAIIEVGLPQGLDALAVFADGSVRYINHAEKLAVFEPAPPDIAGKARKVLAASQPAVDKIGPWDKGRLPPPPAGAIRLTFLVSDGLYFGQGAIEAMEKEPTGGPIVAASVELLQAVVDKAN